jgi:hypothetical protein
MAGNMRRSSKRVDPRVAAAPRLKPASQNAGQHTRTAPWGNNPRANPRRDVTAVYDQYDMLDEKRAAVNVLGKALSRIVVRR